eukprot:754857-Pyramimonas_sp.AAC.1
MYSTHVIGGGAGGKLGGSEIHGSDCVAGAAIGVGTSRRGARFLMPDITDLESPSAHNVQLEHADLLCTVARLPPGCLQRPALPNRLNFAEKAGVGGLVVRELNHLARRGVLRQAPLRRHVDPLRGKLVHLAVVALTKAFLKDW